MPFGLATPGWMLEIGCSLMRTESELVLKSRRVVPVRLLAAGFQFQFPDWPAAARDLVGRWGEQEHRVGAERIAGNGSTTARGFR